MLLSSIFKTFTYLQTLLKPCGYLYIKEIKENTLARSQPNCAQEEHDKNNLQTYLNLISKRKPLSKQEKFQQSLKKIWHSSSNIYSIRYTDNLKICAKPLQANLQFVILDYKHKIDLTHMNISSTNHSTTTVHKFVIKSKL